VVLTHIIGEGGISVAARVVHGALGPVDDRLALLNPFRFPSVVTFAAHIVMMFYRIRGLVLGPPGLRESVQNLPHGSHEKILGTALHGRICCGYVVRYQQRRVRDPLLGGGDSCANKTLPVHRSRFRPNIIDSASEPVGRHHDVLVKHRPSVPPPVAKLIVVETGVHGGFRRVEVNGVPTFSSI